MRKVDKFLRIGKHVVPAWLIVVVLVSTIGGAVLVYDLSNSFTMTLQVKEPIAIVDHPSEFSLFPGETVNFNVTVMNYASVNYSVILVFRLNDSEYQASYVSFSNEVYNVTSGQHDLEAWVNVTTDAPAATVTVSADLVRLGNATVGWWNTDWQYRKSHVINSAPGAGTDYQVKIIVWRTNGIDDAENVYIGTNCRTDFGDIRFTGSDGFSNLDYWLETSDYTKATFWVKITGNLDDTSQTIYMYYGNPLSTTSSNGPRTFLLFRDLAQDFYAAVGNSSGSYGNEQDPGDYFLGVANSINVSPCIWLRYYGQKQYAITPSYLYFAAQVDGGSYGNIGIDLRIRDVAAPTGWQGSMVYVSNAFLNGRHIVVTDYSGTGFLEFASTFLNVEDTPEGNLVGSWYDFNSSSRTIVENVCSANLSHIVTHAGGGEQLTIYHEYYALAKRAAQDPTQGKWGTEETRNIAL
jgi:hypothetical protein